MQTIGFDRHDHTACISDTLAAVEEQCRIAGLQFTPVRQRVLQILLERHRAVGAYEILDVLRDEGLGSQPPVAYRALEFLRAHGFAHRVERLNAFIACTFPGVTHEPAFLICRACSAVAEALSDRSQSVLGRKAREAGFTIESTVLEAEGICPNCREPAAS